MGPTAEADLKALFPVSSWIKRPLHRIHPRARILFVPNAHLKIPNPRLSLLPHKNNLRGEITQRS